MINHLSIPCGNSLAAKTIILDITMNRIEFIYSNVDYKRIVIERLVNGAQNFSLFWKHLIQLNSEYRQPLTVNQQLIYTSPGHSISQSMKHKRRCVWIVSNGQYLRISLYNSINVWQLFRRSFKVAILVTWYWGKNNTWNTPDLVRSFKYIPE